MRRLRSRSTDQRGTTLLEVSIASLVLAIAVTVFFSGLISTQNTERYTRLRNEALDDLRLMANVFAKEARQATAVTLNEPHKVVMVTRVNGTATSVTWEVVSAAGVSNLRRVAGTSDRTFVIKLVSPAVFSYNNSATPIPPSSVRTVRLDLATKLSAKYPSVSLGTEVSLRNVR